MRYSLIKRIKIYKRFSQPKMRTHKNKNPMYYYSTILSLKSFEERQK